MVINAVIGLYYYLSWATRLFGHRTAELPVAAGPVPRLVALAIGTATTGTVLLSVLPQLVLGFSP
jgi:NADH-quinone oxidoreductase subunit N